MYKVFLLVIILSFALSANSQQVCNIQRYVSPIFTSQVTQEPAIYGTSVNNAGNNQNLSFDFYEPANLISTGQGDTLTKRPLIVMAFGGSFLGGDKRQAELVDYCEAMAELGFCVASIDYRVGFNIFSTDSATRAVYRGYQDMCAAIRYFRQFAGTYDIDPNNIYAGGNSAGSFNAMHAAFGEDSDRQNVPGNVLQATFNNPDLGDPDSSGNTYPQFREPNAVINLWGAIGLDTWVRTGDVPIISFHGDNDNVININAGSPYGFPIFPVVYGMNPIHVRAINEGLVEESHLFQGGHELWNNAALMDSIIEESSDFLFTNLLKPGPKNVSGNLSVCSSSVETYCVNNAPNSSKFCWSVTNGTILSETGSCVTIQWNLTGSGNLQFTERTCHDAEGSPVNSIININPSAGPVANFAFNYVNAGITFNNTSTGGTSYLWDFGDGNTDTSLNPSYTYTTNGTYTVTLTVTDASGCSTIHTDTVHQFCQPTWVIGANPTPTGLYQTFNWVQSSNPVAGGSNVDFKAGDYIELLQGFEVMITDDFLAEIVPCNN